MGMPIGKKPAAKRTASRKAAPKKSTLEKTASKKTVAGKMLTAVAYVAKSMPAWKVVTHSVSKAASPLETDSMKTEHGPSIAQLSAKFFGTEEVADSGRKAGNVFAPVDKTIKTVQIAPKKGGPAKTADIDTKSGKISIVQG